MSEKLQINILLKIIALDKTLTQHSLGKLNYVLD